MNLFIIGITRETVGSNWGLYAPLQNGYEHFAHSH